MRSPKKASGKSVQPTPSIVDKFHELAALYNTDDPEVIKQKIMWRYIETLVLETCSGKAMKHMGHHARQFELCNDYINHQQCVFEANRKPEKVYVVKELS